MPRFDCFAFAALAAAAVVLPAVAHTDDPKAKEAADPAWVGPAFRADLQQSDGLGGLEFPQSNIALASHLPIGEFGGSHSGANDIWGYASPGGREYAILGLECGTGFVDVTVPGNGQVLATFAGPCCTWRDIRTYGTYAYVVSECGSGGQDGIQVFDLSDIDTGQITELDTITTGGSASHNVVINTDSGYLYRTGGSAYGLSIYDLNADPVNPPLVADWPDRYVHDATVVTLTTGPYAGREIAFLCSGDNNGWVDPSLDIVDVTDKNDLQNLARLIYDGGAYSHQGALSADEQYFFLGDELDEDGALPTTTFVIDVSHLQSPSVATTFTNGLASVGHNMFVRGTRCYQANYSSGVRVFDVADPLAATEIAYFDTRPEDDDKSFQGLWGVYPLLPSGTILGSDRQRGLFVLNPNLPANGPDLDGDGSVGLSDLLIVLANWGPCAACNADLDANGSVGLSDLLIILSAWTG